MCGMCVQCSAKSSKSGGGTAQMLVIKLINETWHEIFPLSFLFGLGIEFGAVQATRGNRQGQYNPTKKYLIY